MGFIYSASVSVMIVLRGQIWKIIESVSSTVSPRALTHDEMKTVEDDTWISRAWTYQEIINSRAAFFTTLQSDAEGHVIPAEKFFNCVGFSIDQWKKKTGQGHNSILEVFPNLNTLEDTLADVQMRDYLDRSALAVLSNISLRKFDPDYPQNMLLACMGALTKDVSWGPPSTTLAELAETLMTICEKKEDYSFIYTRDVRSYVPGMRWRPSPSQLESKGPVHLVPVANWYTSGDQKGQKDPRGVSLNRMVRLHPAETMSGDAEYSIRKYVYGLKDPIEPDRITGGIFRYKEGEKEELDHTLLRFLKMIGWNGDCEPRICESGLFFSQLSLGERDEVEMYAAADIGWVFGSPGLVRWIVDGEFHYSAGVFIGLVAKEDAKLLLLN